ncbi:MAG: hypothetical protein CBARDCOR_1062 [uncultured Caballeronia sp.]|nr:MAG: hypothetical protein CBARDCOR_1062 [uncultured Caballeronia sp.]
MRSVIQQRFDLRLETVQRAGNREDQQQRHDKQAGIEINASSITADAAQPGGRRKEMRIACEVSFFL